MKASVETLIKNLQKRNIEGNYYQGKKEAVNAALKFIPLNASVGFSGSMTLEELGLIKLLEERGDKVFNPYKPGISREESLEIRREAVSADYYLASANAVSLAGELVFVSAFGNRTAGVAYGKNALVICGVNKIVPDLAQAFKRAREYSSPLNCKRLNWASACLKDASCRQEVCFAPENKRMCCQTLVIESEVTLGRLKVILVGESLGF